MPPVIRKVLFITLNNIGDVILTLPALDGLRERFPDAKITVMTGLRTGELFENNPSINRVIVFDKHAALKDKIKLFRMLAKERFDLVVDLRNTLLGALLPVRYKTWTLMPMPKSMKHMRDRHLYKSSNQLPVASYQNNVGDPAKRRGLVISQKSLYIKPEDEEYIKGILKENNISAADRLIIIAAGARSHTKRWPKERFAELINRLGGEVKAKIVLVGDKDDEPINKYISEQCSADLLDLTGKTTLLQLGFLLKQAQLLFANDSAVLHLASYFNIPVVAIFGISSELKYGPWSDNSVVVKKEIPCRPCEKAQCPFGTLECMQLIKVEDVLSAVRRLLNRESRTISVHSGKVCGIPAARSSAARMARMFEHGRYPADLVRYKRILIARTDRIGDVVLSTPVIKALRENYPDAYIAMIVSPSTREIIHGNPYLDEVIIYDKDNKHKRWLGSFEFSQELKRKKFDLAVILHPTNRMHLISFFAGIPRRIGYNRKLGFLLTDKLKHTKQMGEKHELEYNLDLLRYLGIEPKDNSLYIPIKQESEKWAEELFIQEGISSTDKLLGLHPAASCPSRIWPLERFAEAADRLIEKYGFRVLVFSGPKDIDLAKKVLSFMKHKAVNLAGKTTISQLAGLLKRCSLFISTDSGPMHIASALGVPVISIFGRNDPGLGSKRWGPVGAKARVIHKQIGCIKCLAHNCLKEFSCLKAVSTDEVLKIADEILRIDLS